MKSVKYAAHVVDDECRMQWGITGGRDHSRGLDKDVRRKD
jgi:hypothetical protein